MRLLIYSYFSLEDERQLGGAQAFIAALVPRLARHAQQIIVACPAARCPQADLPGNVTLVDELVAVDNEDATPAQTQRDLRVLHRLTQWADVAVTIDTHYPLTTEIPVILCLNNFSYGPETRSVFGLNWDAVVVPSNYAKDCVEWYFGSASWEGGQRPIHVVPYGLEPRAQVPPAEAAAYRAGWNIPGDARLLAFPHRPDPAKGFEVALQSLALLRGYDERFSLMVPAPPAAEIYAHQRTYMQDRIRSVERLGLTDAVCFHPWIDRSAMPAYLSLAEWTLCPSTLPETFGLSVAESIFAGVPVVATQAGAVAEILPAGHGVSFVEFNDPAAIAEAVRGGCDTGQLSQGYRRLMDRYNWDRCVDGWLRVLSTTTINRPRFVPTASDDGPGAPWLRTLPSGRVWHDYLAAYVEPATPDSPLPIRHYGEENRCPQSM